MKKRRKYPRHCCSRCNIMHHSYDALMKHKRSMGSKSRPSPKRRRARKSATGFALMSKRRRRFIARKGGAASARARGYR